MKPDTTTLVETACKQIYATELDKIPLIWNAIKVCIPEENCSLYQESRLAALWKLGYIEGVRAERKRRAAAKESF